MASAAQVMPRSDLSLPDDYGLVIGGEEVTPSDRFAAVDPSTGVEWASVAQASDGHVDEAVRAAAAAFRSWRRSSLAERQELLWRLGERVAEAPYWPTMLAIENGRPIREAVMADVPVTLDIFRYYAGLVRDHGGEHIDAGGAAHLYTVREPLGPIAALIPWNSPLISTALKLAPALATGNTVVLKPSEFAAPSVVEFVRNTADLVPPGVVNVVTGFGPSVGAALVAHPDVAKITFTGGIQTARHILRAAAENVTPTIMELGGKSAFLICADADLEAAVHDVLTGIYFQNGEVCVAASRLFLHESIREEFLARLLEIAREIRIGDALDPATEVGPLVTAAHRDRVMSRIEAAVSEGAKVLLGGERAELGGDLAGGFYLQPTILSDEGARTSASRDEIFGPVLVVETWRDENDVLERANDTEYGLAAGVWTSDLARAHRIADALDAGTVWVNTWLAVPSGQPLGGVKRSGFGREMCAETLLEYSAAKAVSMSFDTTRPGLWGAGA
jgi:acyl-CoA reductase-like NAD-dependent aldehyde dehydrogenase